MTSHPLYQTLHPLYLRYNTHSIYDITSAVYIAQYALYMRSHPWFMTLQHSIHDIKAIISHLTPIISDSTSTVSLSSLPDFRSYNPLCMYDNTTTICMTSYELHMESHPLFMILLFMISHHTHCIHVIKPRIPVIACTVSGWLLIVYWLYHSIKQNHSI